MELYENQANRLGYNLRLNEILYLPFSSFTSKKNRNQLEVVVKAPYGLHPNK